MTKPICKINDCYKPKKTKGYCSKHYERLRKHGSPYFTLTDTENKKGCKVQGCDQKHKSLGLCKRHYQIQNRGRNPHTFVLNKTPTKFIEDWVEGLDLTRPWEKSEDCILWPFYLS